MKSIRRKRYPDPTQFGDVDAASSYALMLGAIGAGKRVLEFGCATGYMSRLMAAAGNRVTGIEVDPDAAAIARSWCDEVIVADLDTRPLLDLLPGTPFDVAVFGDVLEHLRDPWRVLDETRAFLGPQGYAVISIPNVAHGAIRLALLQGRFDYRDLGLLDDTHLRFFTAKTVHELCLRAGYRISEIKRTKQALFGDSAFVPRLDRAQFDPAVVAAIEADPDHDTLQFVVRATPLGDDERLVELIGIVAEARERADRAEAQVERLERAAGDARHDIGPDEAAERAGAVAAGAALAERVASLEAEIAALTERNEALAADFAAGEARAAALSASLAKAETTRGDFEHANRELARAREGEAALRETFAREIAQLRESVSHWQMQLSFSATALEEMKYERDRMRVDATDVAAARATLDAVERNRQLNAEASRLREAAAERDRLREELRAVRDELDAVADTLRSTVVTFSAFMDGELERTRREITYVDQLIQRIQSSRWWKVKVALTGVRARVAARVRRRPA